jgi:hypothetical protein
LEAELVSQPKRNDNMPNEFVVSQSCSRVNAARMILRAAADGVEI